MKIHPPTSPWRRKVYDLFIGNLQQNKVESVLDAGCSDGEVIISLAYRFPEIKFTGIDLRDDEINMGLRKIEKNKLHNIELRKQYFFESETQKYDVIIFSEVYEHLVAENQVLSLRLLGKKINDDGRLIFTSPNGEYFLSKLESKIEFKDRYSHDFFDNPSQTNHWLEPSLGEILKIVRSLGYSIDNSGYFNLPKLQRHSTVQYRVTECIEGFARSWLPNFINRLIFRNIYLVLRKESQSPLIN